MRWVRPKTAYEDDIQIFLHCNDWAFCPYHAIASVIACACNPSKCMFPLLGARKSAVQALNDVFSKFEDLYDHDSSQNKPKRYYRGMTSHSVRSTAINTLQENGDLSSEWVSQRAGFSLAKQSTKMVYFRGTEATDAACGLNLSGDCVYNI